MAINVGYGPIGMAMGLASNAGKGQYNQQQFGDDVQFANLMQRAQQEADQRRANEIQSVMQYNRMGDQNNQNATRDSLEQQQIANSASHQSQALGVQKGELALRTAQMQNDTAYKTGMLGVAQQRADTGDTRADAYAQHMAAYQQKTNELGAYDAQVKAADQELKALQDPILSKTFGATKRDDVDDKTWGAAQQKLQQAQSMRDAKIQDVIAHAKVAPPAPSAAPQPMQQQQPAAAPMARPVAPTQPGQAPAPAAPGMQPTQPMPATPEVVQSALQTAAAEIGVRPATVDAYPPPTLATAMQAKQMAMQQSSDPMQQRVEFYKLLIAAGMDPRKPPQQSPAAPGLTNPGR